VASSRAAAGSSVPGAAAAAVDAARGETKALPHDQAAPPDGWEPSQADTDRLIASVAASLDALLARQQEVIAARLRSPKVRKGTRYWSPGEYTVDTRAGDGAIDSSRVVSAQRWSEETTATLEPLISAAAQTTAADCVMALTGAPATDATLGAAAGGIHAATLGALGIAALAVEAFLTDVADFLTQEQQKPITLDELVAGLRALFASRARHVADTTATAVAPSAINGAAETAAAAVSPQVVRTWITQQDDKVRPAHRAVNGETLPVMEPYDVGGFPMRYPGDPIAPPDLTRNCRCRLLYRQSEL
jgi:hypothetical protein